MTKTANEKSDKLVLIVDYGMGNAGSVKNALDALGVESVVSKNPRDLKQASHVILPGVGAFDKCMSNLKKFGFVGALKEAVFVKKKPFLGICLGMQILAEYGEEGGKHKGLGWFSGTTRRFSVDDGKFHLPHVGWNDVEVVGKSPLFKGVNHPIFYFVHSFHFVPADKKVVAGRTLYGEQFVSAVASANIFGVQFHPEKSQHEGLKVIKNFLETK